MLPKRMIVKGLPLLCLVAITLLLLARNASNLRPISNQSELMKTIINLQKTQNLNKLLAVRSVNSSRNVEHTIRFLNDSSNDGANAGEGLRKTIRSWFDLRPSSAPATRDLSTHPLFPGYMIENPDMCQGEKVDVLTYLHSAAQHRDMRRQIRNSWASPQAFRNLNVKVLFVLGRPADQMTQLQIESEYASYGDIVQGDFADTFKNLTYKAIVMLTWVNTHCAHARYIVKVDDDMFVDMYRVVSDMIPKLVSKQFAVACDYKSNMPIPRDPKIKWYVHDGLLPGRKLWPPFCSGYFAVMTGNLVPKLFDASFDVKEFIPIDDAYLFGLLVERRNLTHDVVNIHDLISVNERPDPRQEITVNGKFEYVAFRVKVAEDHKTLWSLRANKLSPWEEAHSNYLSTFHEPNSQTFVVV